MECGLSPSEALQSARRVAADASALADRIGTLEEGKIADLVVVNGEPLSDIKVMADTGNIAYVVKGGRIVHRAGAAEDASS